MSRSYPLIWQMGEHGRQRLLQRCPYVEPDPVKVGLCQAQRPEGLGPMSPLLARRVLSYSRILLRQQCVRTRGTPAVSSRPDPFRACRSLKERDRGKSRIKHGKVVAFALEESFRRADPTCYRLPWVLIQWVIGISVPAIARCEADRCSKGKLYRV